MFTFTYYILLLLILFPAFYQKRHIAKQLCHIHPESGQDRFKALQNVRRTYCDYNLEGINNKNKNEEQEEDKNIFNIDIPLAFVILSLTLIILSITFVKMFKHISIKSFSNMRSSSTPLLEGKCYVCVTSSFLLFLNQLQLFHSFCRN